MPTIARLSRAAALLLALLSVVVLGNAREAACEMHGLGGMRAPSEAVVHHGSDHASPATTPPAGHHHAGGQECCCIDECSPSIAVATAPVTPTLLVAFVAAQPRRVFDERSAQTAPPEPDRLLPFANGPPAGRLL
jgi:hypothetical protein